MRRPKNCPADMPVFLCTLHPAKRKIDAPTYRFHCPYCLVTHVHGAQDGHRTAHCHTVNRNGSPVYSPLKAKGYWLVGPRRAGNEAAGEGKE